MKTEIEIRARLQDLKDAKERNKDVKDWCYHGRMRWALSELEWVLNE